MMSLLDRFTTLATTICILTVALNEASAQTQSNDPEWLRAPYLNVVLSIQHTDAMRKFYGETLALESLRDFDLPARVGRPFDTIMIRFRVGRSEIKMIPHENISRPPGGRDAAAGLRTLSIPLADGEALAARIQTATGKEVEWQQEKGYRVSWVRDPDDNEIELRWYPIDAPKEALQRLELGITTNELEASRRHYREWLGLPDIGSRQRAGFHGETHQYRVGDSVLRLSQSSNRLATDTGWTKDGYGLRYVQFIVNDAYALHESLKAKGATIAQEPTPLGTSTVLLFAADPDGVINECVGPAKK